MSEESYNYLKWNYSKGNQTLEELLNDEHITGQIAKKAEKELRKYCVFIEDEYVPIRRDAIVSKLLQVYYSHKDCSVSTLYDHYLDFLKEHRLENDDRLGTVSPRAFEARLDDKRYVLQKYKRRVRYYNMDDYDLERFFQELQLDLYDGMEISALKLFNTHKELMEEFNILDEYELHNLMKKNEGKLHSYRVKLGRMPLLMVGDADREQQHIELLYKIAPIDIHEYGEIYENEYGVRSETVIANGMKYLDRFYSNGMLSVDYVLMTPEEYQRLGAILQDDFYFIEDIIQQYQELFPHGDTEKINIYNLKSMGFRVYINYVIRNTYSNAEDYFKQLITSQEIIDVDKFDKRILYIQAFCGVLETLRVDFDILEFEKSKYITFSRFSKGAPDITKEDLKQFVSDVDAFENAPFFTIKSIRKKGYKSKIDDIGFDDWFYGALLRSNKKIRYVKVGGTFVFGRIDRQMRINEFFMFLMEKFRKIDVVKFAEYLNEEYGVQWDRYKIVSKINQSSMHYDPIMEKVYINKKEYYEDI